MMQPVVRDIDVVTSSVNQNVDALNPAGKKYDEVVYWENKTEMDDYLATYTPGSETILGVIRGGGNWDMADWESAGGGVSYVVAGKSTPISYYHPRTGAKRKVGFTPNGTTPSMAWGASGESLFTLSAGDHINGWDMDATGVKYGLLINQAGNYYVTNTTVKNAAGRNTTGHGIRVNGVGSVLHISGSKLLNNVVGLSLVNGAKGFADKLLIEGNTGQGIDVNGVGGSTYLEITNSTITKNKIGMLVNYANKGNPLNEVFASNVDITENFEDGVLVFAAKLNIFNSRILDNGMGGLWVQSLVDFNDPPAIVTVTDVTITGNKVNGIMNEGGEVTVTGSTVTGNGRNYINRRGIILCRTILDGGTLIVDGEPIEPVTLNGC